MEKQSIESPKKDLWLQVHLSCIKAVSPAFSVKPISFPRSQHQQVCQSCRVWYKGDFRVPRTSQICLMESPCT
ncbi:hypothetical protein BDR04DRAFT_100848 [Suillus decipiens]|nr:hypothetical protein BDR04DRAFT_100848 [Suillus decipiens]